MAAFSDGFVIIQMSSLGKGGWGWGGGGCACLACQAETAAIVLRRQKE